MMKRRQFMERWHESLRTHYSEYGRASKAKLKIASGKTAVTFVAWFSPCILGLLRIVYSFSILKMNFALVALVFCSGLCFFIMIFFRSFFESLDLVLASRHTTSLPPVSDISPDLLVCRIILYLRTYFINEGRWWLMLCWGVFGWLFSICGLVSLMREGGGWFFVGVCLEDGGEHNRSYK